MTTQMIIRIEPEMKTRLRKLAQAEGKSTNQVVRELIENYIRERDLGAYIDDLWTRMGKQLTARDISLDDVARAVQAVRHEPR
jgi:predicted DNA-binding protein